MQKIYKKSVFKVYLGVDTEIFRENNQIKRRNVVLSIGPLRFVKSHDFVIKALGLLPADERPTLVIVGGGCHR
ncbi:MAG: glycosyltransferase [Candidatus Thermoplasmatota archaeon]|nr:glycosyltransferase [Candidatus Thermoplasmatota archaeon]